MARLDPRVADLAAKFVLVRLSRISGLDLRLFDFDHDLNFFVFFVDPEERVLGRYGGRDAHSAEARLSLIGLRHVMESALTRFARSRKEPVPKREGVPLRAENFVAAKRLNKGECIHCHQINEFRREELVKAGQWTRDLVWRYPLPENIGLTLAVDEGNLIRRVRPDGPAATTGLRPEDRLRSVNGLEVASFADVQFALDRAPSQGAVAIGWLRDGKAVKGTLKLEPGWKRTDLGWRSSLRNLVVPLPFRGDDLSAQERQTLGLKERQLAFRQKRPLPESLKRIGLGEEDAIVGIDGVTPELTEVEFRGYLRSNYLLGDRVRLTVLRRGQRIELPLTFR